MKLIEKWKTYFGAADERVEAETNRISKTGFVMLMFGYLVYFYYLLSLKQAKMMVDVETTGSGSMSFNLPEIGLFVWFVATMVFCAVRSSRKGFADNGRFAETDEFPAGYFTLVSALAGIGAGALTALCRVLATLQVGGSMEWMGLIVAMYGISLAILVFGACLLGFYLLFRSAKKNREREAALFREE